MLMAKRRAVVLGELLRVGMLVGEAWVARGSLMQEEMRQTLPATKSPLVRLPTMPPSEL